MKILIYGVFQMAKPLKEPLLGQIIFQAAPQELC